MHGRRFNPGRIAPALVSLSLAAFLAGTAAAAVETFPDLRWRELTPAVSPSPRLAPAMAYDPVSQKVVLFGGYDETGHRGDTWTFDGTTWVEETPAISPPARAAGKMAFDAVSSRIVMFGGFDGSNYLGDTWVWDGATSTWTEGTTQLSPVAVTSPQVFTDPKDGRVMMFGGYDGSRYQNGTWRWTDDGWKVVHSATSPSGRSAAITGLDAARKSVVMFGGIADLNPWNTWRWNGEDWSEESPTIQPFNRYDSGAAWCPQLNDMVLFGGGIGIGDTHDTWAWTGSDWRRLKPETPPSIRESFGIAFDEAIGKVVLFGGVHRKALLGDTWVLETP